MKLHYGSIVCAAILLSACGGSSNSGSKVSLAITDAPVDEAEHVFIKFNSVTLGQGANAQEFDLSDTAPIDLLTLQGEQSAFLVDGAEIPPGEYRITFSVDAIDTNCSNPTGEELTYVQIDGTAYPLAVPSGELRLTKTLTVAAGGLASYTVDFDLRKALSAERGPNGCYNLNPTSLRVVDNAEVGSLAGEVQASALSNEACTGSDAVTGEGYSVFVFQNHDATPVSGEEVTSSLATAVEGSDTLQYTVGFLLAGDYTGALACVAEDGETIFLDQGNVTISADSESAAPLSFPTTP